MKIIGIIPARYGSTRFPKKVLADLGGKTVLERVYRQALAATHLSEVWIATDHPEIAALASKINAPCLMTSDTHRSGTDRCAEALRQIDSTADFVINIQGDEPFVSPSDIDTLAKSLQMDTPLATLICPIHDLADLASPQVVKVVKNKHNYALYFSRSPIPFVRDAPIDEWLIQGQVFYRHIGMYAYRSDILQQISRLEVAGLERAESLEQLRWLNEGYAILTAEIAEHKGIGIDTVEDLAKAQKLISGV
ncbi:MAG: 3-deoxy-manno-octulosonate cytidylyltransferase [Bernardetiaceae bacterium]|nr:3-deoxy-manno-octulosonate cytidylyltransferase [Bernardetiaceae bacterium]